MGNTRDKQRRARIICKGHLVRQFEVEAKIEAFELQKRRERENEKQ
jgi:hypothetical protein